MAVDYPLGYMPPPGEYARAPIFPMSDMSKAVNRQLIHNHGRICEKYQNIMADCWRADAKPVA